MEMCPYCGEDVPADSKSCWKCGTEISGSGDAVSGDAPPAIEMRNKEKQERQAPLGECPFCGAVVGLKALRCNGCGKVLRRGGGGFNWAKASWAAFAVVLLTTVGGLIYAKVSTHEAAPDPGRETPLAVSFDHLARIYLRDVSGNKEFEREVSWEAEHEKKYVEWQGVITEVHPDEGRVDVDQGALAATDEVDVRLTLKDPAALEQQGLKRGKLIKYSARLIEYRPTEGLFALDNALILEE